MTVNPTCDLSCLVNHRLLICIPPLRPPPSGSRYLIADFSVDCNTKRYESMKSYAIVMVIIYPIGAWRGNCAAHTTHTSSRESSHERNWAFFCAGITVLYLVLLCWYRSDINPQADGVQIIAYVVGGKLSRRVVETQKLKLRDNDKELKMTGVSFLFEVRADDK